MPTFRVTAPNGKTYDVTGPDGSTAAQALARVQAQLGGGGSDGQAQQNVSPLRGDGENLMAGIGQGVTSIARGVGQLARKVMPSAEYSMDLFGLPGDQATIDEAKRLDAPLLGTKAGLGGSLIGQIAPMVLAAPLMGSGVAAGGVSGVALGASLPVATGESRAKNMAIGGAGGAAAPVLGRLLGAGYGAVRGVMEPFRESGRQAIAGRTLRRFGVDPGDVAGLSNAPTITGARPSLAELIQRPQGAAGAARLQDAIRTLDPEIAGQMLARGAENNASRVNALSELAGRGGARDFAIANRAGTAGSMYDDAFRVAADGAQMTAEQTRTMRQLMRAPAIRAAARDARVNASNSGMNVGAANASGSVEGLHNVKLALDAAITRASNPTTAAGEATLRGLRNSQRRLVGFIESISPEYASARGTYAQMSRPINQMDIAEEVLSRGTANGSNLGANVTDEAFRSGGERLAPNALMRLMRNPEQLMRNATGRNLGRELDRVMDPDQLQMLNAVVRESDRAAAIGSAARGPGSPTAQRLASSNLLRQIGLPENMVDNALVQTLMRPLQFGAAIAEPRIQQLLLEITQNPAMAEQIIQRATPAMRFQLQRIISNQALAQGVRSSVPAAVLGASNGGQ